MRACSEEADPRVSKGHLTAIFTPVKQHFVNGVEVLRGGILLLLKLPDCEFLPVEDAVAEDEPFVMQHVTLTPLICQKGKPMEIFMQKRVGGPHMVESVQMLRCISNLGIVATGDEMQIACDCHYS